MWHQTHDTRTMSRRHDCCRQQGQIDHYDNRGNKGTILPGDAPWMKAKRGLIQLEQPAEGVTVRSLQLWVDLPAADKPVEPHYAQVRSTEQFTRADGGR
jgi:quercetin 2,3-dioxygenase